MMSVLSHGLPGINVSVGESINLAPGSLAPLSPTKRKRTFSEGATFASKLPPAVANVPSEHIRGYVHSKRVNSYLVGNTLGEGSFAKVKEAFHSLVGEKVAMKIIDKKKAQQDPYVAKNFRREAKLLQMVHHTNILHLLEVIETDTSFYLITELCTGGELMNYIYKKGKLDETETRKFMRQIVSAVDHLHKAGIIHRDLKVENMLLDSSQDIKIIDFGLSNEEYIEGEEGRVHCSTQCGSPAYAAPELLGHKDYGPEVDIWSIGVNMYAMLTGCLPYTVEPFNITALHAKMLENKMNPIPENLSPTCKDLLRHLLKSNPDDRIKMADIMTHPWMNEGHALPFGPAPYPNKIEPHDIDDDITEHMVVELKLKHSEEELKQELISNRSTSSSAVYHLLVARFARYRRQFKSRQTRPRHKSKRFSRDQGYYEGDEDDARSTISVPTRRASTRHQQTRTVPVQLRPKAEPRKDRPFSDNTLEDSIPRGVRYERRKTLPTEILETHLAKLRASQASTSNSSSTNKSSSLPRNQKTFHRAITQPDMSKSIDHRPRRISPPHEPPPDMARSLDRRRRISPNSAHHDPHYEYDIPHSNHSHLAPVHPPPGHGMRPTTMGHNRAQLNKLREDLQKNLHHPIHHPPPATAAWHSNPPSNVGSKNASRQGSRNPSRAASRQPSGPLNRMAPHTTDSDRSDELVFHHVESHTLPKSNKRNSFHSDISDKELERHLPPLQSKPPTRLINLDQIHKRKNGYLSEAGSIEVKTDLSMEAIISEVLRVADSMKMREIEQNAKNRVTCLCRGVRFQVIVSKDLHNVCTMLFQWLSGGEHDSYKNITDHLTQLIKF